MRFTTRRVVDLGFAIALLILLLVGLASLSSISALRTDQRWVEHTEQVLRESSDVLEDLASAETGQRGFLLTRQERFLEAYTRAAPSIAGEIEVLRMLTRDNPVQLARAERLAQLADLRMETMQRAIRLGRAGEFERAAALVGEGTGKELMDEIRGVVGAIQGEETELLRERRRQAEASARNTRLIIVLGSILAFLVVGLARQQILRDLRARERAERSLAAREAAVRELYLVASSQELGHEEKLRAMVVLGCRHFRLSVGLLSHIEGDRFEIRAAHDPRGEIREGEVLSLGDTYCAHTLGNTEPIGLHHVGASEWGAHRCYSVFGLEAYLGVPLTVNGRPYGTLAFSDPEPHDVPFTQSDKDFLRLIAQWIGGEIERHQWEEELRQREERFRGLVENASDLIYQLDANGRFTYVNPVAIRTLGYPAQELLGMNILDVAPPERHEEARQLYRSETQPGRVSIYHEMPVVTKSGAEVWLGHSVQSLTQDGRVVALQGLARDITKQREVERMKDEFLSVVSHELRTPLTAIRGSLGLLASGKMGTLEERGQRMLEIAAQNTDRLVRLINDLLDIEKMVSGKVTIEHTTVEAAELVGQAVDEMAGMAEKAGVSLAVEGVEGQLWADPDRMLQVLTNLISNAIKFSPEDGTVRVSMTQRAGEALFRVSDEGRGIPADKLESIFERFQQVDSSDARQKGGTGLGLPIARGIVQQHGGRMWVESEWGRGSTFLFTVPLVPTEKGKGGVVLVCDDDPGVCSFLREVLRRRGHEVLLAGSGEEALRLALSERPSVLLLDLMLPGMSGREVLAELRRREQTRRLPIIVLSGVGEQDAEVDPSHVVDWLTKPVDQEALARAVDWALRGKAEHCNVLIVEDDADLAGLISETLKTQGLTSCIARGGDDAIELSRRMVYDVLLLDVALPDRDGFEVVDWMRRHNQLRHTPLLVYTARDLTEAERERLRLGPTEFITKTRLSLDEVQQRVVALLARAGPRNHIGGRSGKEAYSDRG